MSTVEWTDADRGGRRIHRQTEHARVVFLISSRGDNIHARAVNDDSDD